MRFRPSAAMEARTRTMPGILSITLMFCSFHGLTGGVMLLAVADPELPSNCSELPSKYSFPALYTFRYMPEQRTFMDSVTCRPIGVLAPRSDPAGCCCHGWLLTDCIGKFRCNVRVVNFAAMPGATPGATSGSNTPVPLNIQVSWLLRCKARLQFAADQRNASRPLPTLESLNSSLYVVNAGFQDYISFLNNPTWTALEAHDRTLEIVPSVVATIIEAVQRIYEFGGKHILIAKLPPLGCAPFLPTTYVNRYQDSAGNYDAYGCMKILNATRIGKYHNSLLADSVNDLRDRYRDATFHLADIYRVHRETIGETMLKKMPSDNDSNGQLQHGRKLQSVSGGVIATIAILEATLGLFFVVAIYAWWHRRQPHIASCLCHTLHWICPAILRQLEYIPELWNVQGGKGIFTFPDLDSTMQAAGFHIYPIAGEEHRWTWSLATTSGVLELVDFPSYLGIVNLSLDVYVTFLQDVQEVSGRQVDIIRLVWLRRRYTSCHSAGSCRSGAL